MVSGFLITSNIQMNIIIRFFLVFQYLTMCLILRGHEISNQPCGEKISVERRGLSRSHYHIGFELYMVMKQ